MRTGLMACLCSIEAGLLTVKIAAFEVSPLGRMVMTNPVLVVITCTGDG